MDLRVLLLLQDLVVLADQPHLQLLLDLQDLYRPVAPVDLLLPQVLAVLFLL